MDKSHASMRMSPARSMSTSIHGSPNQRLEMRMDRPGRRLQAVDGQAVFLCFKLRTCCRRNATSLRIPTLKAHE